MALISPLSLSKVNTRVVATRERGTLVFISRSFLRKFHHPQRVSVSQTRAVQEISLVIIIVSLVISWPLHYGKLGGRDQHQVEANFKHF